MIRIYFHSFLFYVVESFLKKLNLEKGSQITENNWIRKII